MTEEAIFELWRCSTAGPGRSFRLGRAVQVGSGGELLDIRGSVEAFFDFHDQNRWHSLPGPSGAARQTDSRAAFRPLRVRAYSCWMRTVCAREHGSATTKKWRYGPVKITLEAWLETNVMVNRKPIHFHNDLWAHGKSRHESVWLRVRPLARCQLGWGRLRSVPYPRRTLGETGFAWPIPNVNVDFLWNGDRCRHLRAFPWC